MLYLYIAKDGSKSRHNAASRSRLVYVTVSSHPTNEHMDLTNFKHNRGLILPPDKTNLSSF